ncbi:MAG: dihydroorotate dehydrogenase [Thermoplasmata archaeon]
MPKTSLITNVGSMQLESPLILASGILDENGYTMRRILEEGAAAVVTKSIGSNERTGFTPPVVADLGENLLNAIGLSNPGIKHFAGEISIAKGIGKPVIGSIFGATAEEFSTLASKMESYGADAIELNLSCPHVKGFGSEVGSDPVLVEEIVTEVKAKVRVPVFAKLTPNVTDIIGIAKAAERADALVLINTVKAIHIDIYARRPTLSNTYGGLSGPAIKPIGIRAVYDVYRETSKEIIGCGGISNFEDVIEYMMAGARAVEIGTALKTAGRAIFDNIKGDIIRFMEAEGIEDIQEIIGAGVKK